jgi:hypothetical protein
MMKRQALALLGTIHADWFLLEAQDDEDKSAPQALVREFVHPDFLTGARFLVR